MENSFRNPQIPEGYKYVSGTVQSGFVIERESDKSQFVFVPVCNLKENGMYSLNDDYFVKFGRRNYKNDLFSRTGFSEEITDELIKMHESVNKYGGFYISRFNISKSIDKKPQSIKGAYPWTNITYSDALEIASNFEKNDKLESHLTYGSEYDSMLEWIIESGGKTKKEVTVDSSTWGNYAPIDKKQKLMLTTTGENENWKANNIYDIAGNIDEWTQETYLVHQKTIRSGIYYTCGDINPAAVRNHDYTYNKYRCTGFRVVLLMK